MYFLEDSELNLLLRGLCTLRTFFILSSNHKNLGLQELLKYFMTSEIFSVDVNAFLISPNYMEFFYIILMARGQLIVPPDYTVHTHNNNWKILFWLFAWKHKLRKLRKENNVLRKNSYINRGGG